MGNRNSLLACINSFLTKPKVAEVKPRQTLVQPMHVSHTQWLSLTSKCPSGLYFVVHFVQEWYKEADQFYSYGLICPFCFIWPVVYWSLTDSIWRRMKLTAQFALLWRKWLTQTGSGIQQNTLYWCRQVVFHWYIWLLSWHVFVLPLNVITLHWRQQCLKPHLPFLP